MNYEWANAFCIFNAFILLVNAGNHLQIILCPCTMDKIVAKSLLHSLKKKEQKKTDKQRQSRTATAKNKNIYRKNSTRSVENKGRIYRTFCWQRVWKIRGEMERLSYNKQCSVKSTTKYSPSSCLFLFWTPPPTTATPPTHTHTKPGTANNNAKCKYAIKANGTRKTWTWVGS